MSTDEDGASPRAAVEEFQSAEILLLQAGRYEEWLDLLADDLRYWMPVVRVGARLDETVAEAGDMAWFDDDKSTLTLRVKRFATGLAVEEAIPARLRYFVQNLRVAASPDGAEIEVISNLIVYRTRGEHQEAFYVGGREDLLRHGPGGWKLARRKIVLDRAMRGPHSHMGMFF